MRTRITLALVTSLLVLPALAPPACADRLGGGLEYDLSSGDADSAVGLFATYFQEIDDLIGYQLGISHVAGDYDLAGMSGDFSRTGVDAAIVFRFPQDTYTTYVGAGTGYHFNDFDGLDVQNKLSMCFLAGAYIELSDTIDLDLNVRYRFLQPDVITAGIEEIGMDALVLRVGVSWPM